MNSKEAKKLRKLFRKEKREAYDLFSMSFKMLNAQRLPMRFWLAIKLIFKKL